MLNSAIVSYRIGTAELVLIEMKLEPKNSGNKPKPNQ